MSEEITTTTTTEKPIEVEEQKKSTSVWTWVFLIGAIGLGTYCTAIGAKKLYGDVTSYLGFGGSSSSSTTPTPDVAQLEALAQQIEL
jgi:hypothetical protein